MSMHKTTGVYLVVVLSFLLFSGNLYCLQTTSAVLGWSFLATGKPGWAAECSDEKSKNYGLALPSVRCVAVDGGGAVD